METVHGKHSVRAVLRNRPRDVRRMVLRARAAGHLGEFVDLARAAGVAPETVRDEEFLRLAGLGPDDRCQDVLVIVEPLRPGTEHDFDALDDARLVVVLDQITDPQNFGTILRTAAFFGVDGVVWPKNRAVDLTPTVTRVAVGGAELVRLYRVTNLARSLDMLKERGFWVYGFDERGPSTLAETRFDRRSVLVIGAEGSGLRQLTLQRCDQLVRIPGGRPDLGSLNAAVAAGIVVAEFYR